MILSTLPVSYNHIKNGLTHPLIMVSVIEWVYYFVMILCALGLFKRREWARNLAVNLFGIYFLWTIYVAYSLSGPSFRLLWDNPNTQNILDPYLLKGIIITLLATYSIWPIVVIFFLTHPRAKMLFDPKFDPHKEDNFL
jgi:hypothetical protein